MTIGPAELQTLWVSCYMFQIYPLQEVMGNCSYFPNLGPACTDERLMICNGSAYDHVSRYMSFNSVLIFLTQYVNIMAADIAYCILSFCVVRRMLRKEPQYATVKTEYCVWQLGQSPVRCIHGKWAE